MDGFSNFEKACLFFKDEINAKPLGVLSEHPLS